MKAKFESAEQSFNPFPSTAYSSLAIYLGFSFVMQDR
jgi:hypothetical protein